mgnify:CR=1 FL=1
MNRRQRVAAYGVCRTTCDGGGIVLVRHAVGTELAGRWLLPGGGLDHGEAPEAAVIREFAEETGLAVRVLGLVDVLDDVLDLPSRGGRVHTVRLIYDVEDVGGSLRREANGSTDAVAVVAPAAIEGLPLTGFTARALGFAGLAPRPTGAAPAGAALRPEPAISRPTAARVQRVAVYGLVVEEGHVLLSRLSADTPAPGMWTLPGGGIDHGEPIRDALAREVWEETGLRLRESRLLAAMSNRFHGTSPSGVAEDFHGVPLVFRASVEPGSDGTRGEVRVMQPGGTTDAAAWVALLEAGRLPLNGLATEAINMLTP